MRTLCSDKIAIIVIIDRECELCIPMSPVDAIKWELFLFIPSVSSVYCFVVYFVCFFLCSETHFSTFVVALTVSTVCVWVSEIRYQYRFSQCTDIYIQRTERGSEKYFIESFQSYDFNRSYGLWVCIGSFIYSD